LGFCVDWKFCPLPHRTHKILTRPTPHPQDFEKSYMFPPCTPPAHTRPVTQALPTHTRPALFLSETCTYPKTTKNSYCLKPSLTSGKIKLLILSIGNQTFSKHLSFCSQQIWGNKNHVSVKLWPAMLDVLSYLLRRAWLNYSVQAQQQHCKMESVHLATTLQESELMFCNNELLHHNVIIAVRLLA